jgi:hypothetical protein
MSLDDAIDRLKSDSDHRNKWVGVYIGVLAVLLAVCSVGGGNATKDATRANIDAANTWAFFQAKNIRRSAIQMSADELDLLLASQPNMPADAKAKFAAKIKDYREQIQKLTSDPVRNEGLDELFVKARRSRPSVTGCAGTPISTGARRRCDRHRAGLRAPDHRQFPLLAERRSRRTRRSADAERLHLLVPHPSG